MESNFIKVSELNNRLSEFKDVKFIIEGIIWEFSGIHIDGFSLKCHDSNVLSEEYLKVFKKYLNLFVNYTPHEGCQSLIDNSEDSRKFDYITYFLFTSYYNDVILEIYDGRNSGLNKQYELNFLNSLNFKIIN